MRLLKLRLENFRRFVGTHSFDVDESLVAIVGPNEAGKSSLLAALEQVGKRLPPRPADRTRGQDAPAIIHALYRIEDEDREDLNTPWSEKLRLVWVSRRSDKPTTTWIFDPQPRRDLGVRAEALAEIRELSELVQDEPPDGWDADRAADILNLLASETETLAEESLDDIRAFSREMAEISEPAESDDEAKPDPILARISAVVPTITELLEHESRPAPWKATADHLRDRLPTVAHFREADRVLHSEYALEELVGEDGDIPPAVANLTGLAGINLHRVAELVDDGRHPEVVGIFELGNDQLKSRFEAVWTQSGVYPQLTAPLDGPMRVVIRTEDAARYSVPEERSDGLRWFLALVAFLATRGAGHPILTVDEAETHLHYDAQADLIDALMTQRLTAQVVYTTHSVGCLPPDLGRGIRAVLPSRGREASTITNSYWSLDIGDELRVGDAPVLFAMGARMLALTIPRFGVVVEGPSDAVLLPTLLRRASGRDVLGYRIVPGLSEAPQTRLAELGGAAGRVVYLTDGDTAGTKLRTQLEERAGVEPDQLFGLDTIADGLTLEDLVPPADFAAAVNDVLTRWSITETQIEADHLPEIGRWNWIKEEALNSHAVERLGKVRVAQTLVDTIGRQGADVAPQYVDALRDLDRALCSAMGVDAAGG